jgi:hypothetical protein
MRAEPYPISPEERLREIAAILARGLRARRDRPATSPQTVTTSAEKLPPDSCVNCLEPAAVPRLSAHHNG